MHMCCAVAVFQCVLFSAVSLFSAVFASSSLCVSSSVEFCCAVLRPSIVAWFSYYISSFVCAVLCFSLISLLVRCYYFRFVAFYSHLLCFSMHFDTIWLFFDLMDSVHDIYALWFMFIVLFFSLSAHCDNCTVCLIVR